jgi:hypothetical protein
VVVLLLAFAFVMLGLVVVGWSIRGVQYVSSVIRSVVMGFASFIGW